MKRVGSRAVQRMLEIVAMEARWLRAACVPQKATWQIVPKVG